MADDFVNLLMGAAPAAPEVVEKDDLLTLLSGPVHAPHTPLDDQMTENLIADASVNAKANEAATQNVAIGLSHWDNLRTQIQEKPFARPGDDWTSSMADIHSDNLLERTHTYFVKHGAVVDASVLKGERRREFLGDITKEYNNIMKSTGWNRVANAKQGSEVLGAVMAKAYIERSAVTPEVWDNAALLSYDTAVNESERIIMGQLGPNPASAAITEESGKRLHALGRLKTLSKEEKQEFIRWSYGAERIPTRNDEEERVFAAFGKDFKENLFQDLNRVYGGRMPQIKGWFAEAYGTTKPLHAIVSLHDKILGGFKMKNAGFIDGDITKEGIYAADKNVPGGISVVNFLPSDTYLELEKQRAEEKTPSEYDVVPPEGTLTAYQEKFGDSLGEAKFAGQMASDRKDRIARNSGITSRLPDPQTFSPTEQAHLTPSAHALLAFSDFADNILQTGKTTLDTLDRASEGTFIGDAGKIWHLGVTRNTYLAQNTGGILSAASNVLDIATETGNWIDTIFPSTGPQPPVGIPSAFASSHADAAYTSKTLPVIQAGAMEAANNARELVSVYTADADKEQEARNARLMAYQAGKPVDFGQHAKDVWGTFWYSIGTGGLNLFADVVDRPGDIALVWAGNKLGDIAATKIAKARGQVFKAHASAAAAKQAGKYLSVAAPGEMPAIEAACARRIAVADTPAKVQEALKMLSASARAVADEVAEATKAGVARASDGTVNRFALDFSKWHNYLGDDLPDSAAKLLEAVPVKPSTLGWARVRDVVRDQLKSVPQNVPYKIRSALADAGRTNMVKIADRMVNRNPVDFDITQLKGDLVAAQAKNDTAGIKTIVDKLAGLKKAHENHSPLDTVRKLDEWEHHSTELSRQTTRAAEVKQRLDAGDTDPALQNEYNALTGSMAERTTSIHQLKDELLGGPLLEEIDRAQLLVAQDTGKRGYGPWMGFAEKMGNLTAAAFGTRNFKGLKEAATSADQLQSFLHKHAENWYMTKLHQAGRQMRNDLVYRRAIKVSEESVGVMEGWHNFEREQLVIGKLPDERARIIAESLPAQQAEIIRLKREQSALVGEYRAMLKLPAGEGWQLDGNKELWKHLSQEDLAQIVEGHPQYFDHFETAGMMRQASPEVITINRAHQAKLNAEADRLQGEITELEANPPPSPDQDKDLPAIPHRPAKQEAKVMQDYDERGGGPDARRKALAAARAEADRQKAMQQDTVAEAGGNESIGQSGQFKREWHAGQLEVKRQEMRELRAKSERVGQAIFEWDGSDLVRINKMLDLFTVKSADTLLKDSVEQIKQVGDSAAQLLILGHGGDAWTSALLPFHLKGYAAADMLRTTRFNTQASGVLLEGLADALNHMTKAERHQLLQVMRTGAGREAFMLKHPGKVWEAEKVAPSGDATIDSNVENFVRHEGAIQAGLIEDALARGFIDKATHDNLKRLGYDPGMYGRYERPTLVDSPDIRADKQRMRGVGKGESAPLDSSELRFKRDLTKYRVYAREADGFIHDELFDTPEAAADFIDGKFGITARKSLGDKADSRRIGKTSNGAEIVVADPIGAEAAKALDFLEEGLPARRLAKYSKLTRDSHIHGFLTGVKGIGGMVISNDEFTSMMVRQGKTEAQMKRQYIHLPPDRHRYGNLANHYVHRKVITEMNAATHSYEQLKTWMSELQEVYTDFGEVIPKLLTRQWGNKFIGAVNSAVKTSQILLSWKTWVGNLTFNVMANEFTGGRVLATKNLPNFARAVQEVAEIGFAPRMLLAGKPDYIEAIKAGVLNGSVFDRSNVHLKRALLSMAGLDDSAKIQARKAFVLGQREALTPEIRRNSTAKLKEWEEMTLELQTLETALEETKKDVIRTLARESVGLFFGGKTATGLPMSELGRMLRESYGMVDDIWRYATFLNLKAEGKTAAQAAWAIKKFYQNYGNLPAAVSNLSRSPLGSLVPAFPYELSRLTWNYIRHKPLRFMALTSIVPAVNMVGATMAGVPLERISASMRANGASDTMSMWKMMAQNLMLFSPKTHNLESMVGLGNTVLPFAQLNSGFGALSSLANKFFPPEDSGTLGAVGRATMGYMANFIGNNPAFNTATTMLTGNDYLTGKPLFDTDSPTWADRGKAAMRSLGRSIIPPYLPKFGSIETDINDALNAPLHPDTERPYGNEQIGTIQSRALLNVPIKGRLADHFARMLGHKPRGGGSDIVNDESLMQSIMYQAGRNREGPGYGKPLALFGDDADKRRFWAHLKSEASTPAEKRAAQDGLRKLAAEEKRYVVSGEEFVRDPTEREQAAFVRSIEQRGSLGHFSGLDLFSQTLTLIKANEAGVDGGTLKNYIETAVLTDRFHQRVPRDPGMVNAALRLTEEWMHDPRAREEFLPFHKWLVQMQVISLKLGERDKIYNARIEELRKEGRVR